MTDNPKFQTSNKIENSVGPMVAPKSGLDFEFKFDLDHIGIAVETLQEGFKFYQALGFTEMKTEEVASEKVRTGFLQLGSSHGPSSTLELLEPMGPESPIRKFLDKRGPGIHHICFRVADIREALIKLKKQNVRLINEEPKLGAHNCMVAFIHPSATGGVLIELSEKGQA